MIVAKKGKLTKKFTKEAWDLLGENKNGWELLSTSDPKEVKKIIPPSGQKEAPTKQVVENKVETAKVEEPVTETPIVNETTETILDELKPKFIEFAKEKLTKGQIKDYFDLVEVSYKANANHDELAGLLADNLNNDIEVLKQKFELQ